MERVERWQTGRPEFQTCAVHYPSLVTDPAAETGRVNGFLEGNLDEAAMAR